MATIDYMITAINGDDSAAKVSWRNMQSGDIGQVLTYAQWADRSVEVEGTFGGAAVTFQGSNRGSTFYVLTDPAGNSISLAASGLKQITEVTCYCTPVVTGGDVTTLVTVTLVCRRTQPLFRQAQS